MLWRGVDARDEPGQDGSQNQAEML